MIDFNFPLVPPEGHYARYTDGDHYLTVLVNDENGLCVSLWVKRGDLHLCRVTYLGTVLPDDPLRNAPEQPEPGDDTHDPWLTTLPLTPEQAQVFLLLGHHTVTRHRWTDLALRTRAKFINDAKVSGALTQTEEHYDA